MFFEPSKLTTKYTVDYADFYITFTPEHKKVSFSSKFNYNEISFKELEQIYLYYKEIKNK